MMSLHRRILQVGEALFVQEFVFHSMVLNVTANLAGIILPPELAFVTSCLRGGLLNISGLQLRFNALKLNKQTKTLAAISQFCVDMHVRNLIYFLKTEGLIRGTLSCVQLCVFVCVCVCVCVLVCLFVSASHLLVFPLSFALLLFLGEQATAPSSVKTPSTTLYLAQRQQVSCMVRLTMLLPTID
jgi:hypothetical protein